MEQRTLVCNRCAAKDCRPFARAPGGRYDPVNPMPKSDSQFDVLVLGEHPAASFCAALLRFKSKLRVLHALLPGESWPDRLVVINPALFELHPLLEPVRK